MKLWFHRREQWDLGIKPLLCVHLKRQDSTTRLLTVYRWGITFK